MITTARVKYGTYTFNPVPQVGFKSSASPLGTNKTGPASRDMICTIVGKILGTSFQDIQSRVWALQVALATQDQNFYWHDGTTLRINQQVKVLTMDMPAEWGTYEANYQITLTYIPLGDVNTPPFLVKYGSYTFSPIPIFGRSMRVERESPDSVKGPNRWGLSLSGFIDKGTIAANKAEFDLLKAAVSADATFQYDSFIQAVKIGECSVLEDTWQRRINYAINMAYSEGIDSGNGVIKMASSRTISRLVSRVAPHYIPFIDDQQVQILGRAGQTISAQGFIIGDTLAQAKTAANIEIEAQFPAPTGDSVRWEDPSSKVTEKYTENRIDWNVTRNYTTPVLTGGIYGS